MPSLCSDGRKTWNSPYINRFLQPDIIIPDLSSPQSWNRYSYVSNRPVDFNDPTGHMMDKGDGGCTNRRDCSKNPSKKDLVASVIETGNNIRNEKSRAYYRQLAIKLALDAYNISFASPDIKVRMFSGPDDYIKSPGINLGYQPGFEGGGLTWNRPGQGTNIKIGESAFSSAGWLAGTIGHENVHLQQALNGTYATVNPGKAKNEVDAYNWQLDHSTDLGLTEGEIEKLESLRQGYMIEIINTTPTQKP